MDTIGLIYKVLSGKADPSEEKELGEWISKSEANRMEFEDIKLLRDNSGKVPADTHFYDGLQQIKILMQRRHLDRQRKRRTTASVIVLLISFAITMLFLLNSGSHEEPVAYHQFESASLAEVIQELENAYDVRIEVEQTEVLACRFTGTFYNDTIEDIVQSVSRSLNLRFEIGGDGEYKLNGHGCSP